MKTHLCLFAAALSFAACQQPGKSPAQQEEGSYADSSTPAANPLPETYYRQLKGTVAGQPVTMHLTRSAKHEFYGYYYYDKIGQPITLMSRIDSTGKLILSEIINSDIDQYFSGDFNTDDHFTGTWHGKKDHPFDLHVNQQNAIQFEIHRYEDSIALFPDKPDGPSGDASGSLLWPVGGADEATLAFLRKHIIGPQFDNPDSAVRKPVHDFLDEYQSNQDEKDAQENGASWSWYASSVMNVAWNQYPLLALEEIVSTYTGGAHGNYGSAFTLIDLSKKKVLKPADVFKPGFQAKLSAALANAVRKQYNIPAGEPLSNVLFDKTIHPNENFFITDKGVIFSYPPYEIAAYAAGQITLFVPFSDIRDIVNEAYLPK